MTERLSQQQRKIIIALARRGRGCHQLGEVMDTAGLRGLNERERNIASASYSRSLKELWQRGLVDRSGRLYQLTAQGRTIAVQLIKEAIAQKGQTAQRSSIITC